MHKNDEKWVKNKINELPTVELKILAWECYKKKYEASFCDEPIDFKKDNFARKSANTALRLYVDKVLSNKPTGQSS